MRIQLEKDVSTILGIIIIICAVIIIFGGVFVYQYFATQEVEQINIIQPAFNSVIFSGVVSDIDRGCYSDGICYMIIDGKKVIFGSDAVPSDGSAPIWGQVIGKPKIGDNVEVFAEYYPYEPNSYSLEGNENYYIKIK